MIASLFAYFCFKVLPPKLAKTVVPTFIVGYCVLGHLHRQFVNYLGWDLDFTGPHMVLTIKLYSIAWNLYDGHLIKKGGELPRATQKCKQFALEEVPSLLEFLGYTFCFSNVLAGPAYEVRKEEERRGLRATVDLNVVVPMMEIYPNFDYCMICDPSTRRLGAIFKRQFPYRLPINYPEDPSVPLLHSLRSCP